MKNFYICICISLFLIGCSTQQYEASDGTKVELFEWSGGSGEFNKCKMDDKWYNVARDNYNLKDLTTTLVADCYAKKPAHELCNLYDYVYQRYFDYQGFVMFMRNSISEALIRGNEDPLKCRNPSNDALIKAKIELEIANRKAKEARSRAAAAEAEAAKNMQRKCRTVQVTSHTGYVYWDEVCD